MSSWMYILLAWKKPFALVRNGDLESLQSLINKHPEMLTRKDKGETLLHKAAAYGKTEICSYLLKSGIEVNVRTERLGGTPLMLASAFNEIETCKYLIENGADLNLQDINGVSALHYAVSNKHVDIVRLLLNYGADKQLKDKLDRTPADIAKELGLQNVLEIL